VVMFTFCCFLLWKFGAPWWLWAVFLVDVCDVDCARLFRHKELMTEVKNSSFWRGKT
jgi:hypothetical protein